MPCTESINIVPKADSLRPQIKLEYEFESKQTVVRLRANGDDAVRLVNILKWADSNGVTVTASYIQY